jgi:8-oxo-dGTP pyrophosphatase MutT (NUDIX family)
MSEPSTQDPVVAKPASTVVLARDTASAGIEVFLVQRQGSMGFMGGMHVFPGGKVSASDSSERMGRCLHDADANAHAQWGEDVEAAGGVSRAVAAVRETFEEAGVLLAHGVSAVDLPPLRARLLAGEDFATLLQQSGLSLRLSMLVPLSRWTTPVGEPVRFDTNFYVARLPEGQVASHETKESSGSRWMSPEAALATAAQGGIRLSPPTARTLEGLLSTRSVDAALTLAASRPPPVILPILRTIDDHVVVVFPGDPEHPVRTNLLGGPTRRIVRKL